MSFWCPFLDPHLNCKPLGHRLGACTGRNVENHVPEYIGWIYPRQIVFTFFLDTQYRSPNVNLGIAYNVCCGLSCGILLIYLDVK